MLTMSSPDVEFCGYSIPHPSEPKLNLRIQTYGSRDRGSISDMAGDGGKTAVDALEKGLDDLMALCGAVEEKFHAALGEHLNRMEVD